MWETATPTPLRGLDEEVVMESESCFITSLWNLIGMTRKMKAEIESSMVGPNPPRSFTESGYKEVFGSGPYDTESSMQILAPRDYLTQSSGAKSRDNNVYLGVRVDPLPKPSPSLGRRSRSLHGPAQQLYVDGTKYTPLDRIYISTPKNVIYASPLARRHPASRPSTSNTMTEYSNLLDAFKARFQTMAEYNNPLDALIARCQKSVQNSNNSSGTPTVVPPPPPIFGDLPAKTSAPAAYSASKVSPAAIVPDSNVNQDVPPAANATRSAISRKLSPVAIDPPPFVPSLQQSSSTSSCACALPENYKATTPIAPGVRIPKTQVQPDQEIDMRYKDLPQRTMQKELRRRGLLIGGLNAELSKRLEKDDEFQARARTAEDYDTMNPKQIYSLCVRRSLPSIGADSLLRDRLKAHDRRAYGIDAVRPKISPSIQPNWPISGPGNKDSRDTLQEKRRMPILKDKSSGGTEMAKTMGQTAETMNPTNPEERAAYKPKTGMLPGRNIPQACDEFRKKKRRCIHDTDRIEETAVSVKTAKPNEHIAFKAKPVIKLAQHTQRACEACRKAKRRCIHDKNGNEDPAKALEPVIPRPTASKAYIKDKRGLMIKNPAPAVEDFAGTRVTRHRVSTAKASASKGKMTRPAQTAHKEKDETRKYNVPSSRRSQLLYQPKDEIALLQICIKLKDVIAWGDIAGFWTMVQDTLQLKTGKPFKRVSRHVRLLVRKRHAERKEIEQRGTISVSRVCAGCRPLLDKWIAGGNQTHHTSPNTSITSTIDGDKDDVSLVEGERRLLDSNDSALEVQKRSATDAWLDTSCGPAGRKKLKLCTSELSSDTNKSSAGSVGCWSLSGSSVTSESSIGDESEGDVEDDVKSGLWAESLD